MVLEYILAEGERDGGEGSERGLDHFLLHQETNLGHCQLKLRVDTTLETHTQSTKCQLNIWTSNATYMANMKPSVLCPE